MQSAQIRLRIILVKFKSIMVFAHFDNKADNHTYRLHGKVCVHKFQIFFLTISLYVFYIYIYIYQLFLQLLPLFYLQIVIATTPFLVQMKFFLLMLLPQSLSVQL